MGLQFLDTLERVTHVHTHTHTHLKDAVVKADKQVPFGHRCILKKERWTDRKYEKLEAG